MPNLPLSKSVCILKVNCLGYNRQGYPLDRPNIQAYCCDPIRHEFLLPATAASQGKTGTTPGRGDPSRPQTGFSGGTITRKTYANVLTDEANAVAVPPFGRYPDIPWGNASLKIRVHSFSSRFSVPQWRTEANEAVTKNDCGCRLF